MRVFRMVKFIPELQLLIFGLLKAFQSTKYISLLQVLLFFIMAVLAVQSFATNDPFYFRDFHTTFLSLFRISTLDGWGPIMYTAIYGCAFTGDTIYPCTE